MEIKTPNTEVVPVQSVLQSVKSALANGGSVQVTGAPMPGVVKSKPRLRSRERHKAANTLPALFKGADKDELSIVLQGETVSLPDGTKGKAKATKLAIPTIAQLKASGVTDKDEIDQAREHAGRVNFVKAQTALNIIAQDTERIWLCDRMTHRVLVDKDSKPTGKQKINMAFTGKERVDLVAQLAKVRKVPVKKLEEAIRRAGGKAAVDPLAIDV